MITIREKVKPVFHLQSNLKETRTTLFYNRADYFFLFKHSTRIVSFLNHVMFCFRSPFLKRAELTQTRLEYSLKNIIVK